MTEVLQNQLYLFPLLHVIWSNPGEIGQIVKKCIWHPKDNLNNDRCCKSEIENYLGLRNLIYFSCQEIVSFITDIDWTVTNILTDKCTE